MSLDQSTFSVGIGVGFVLVAFVAAAIVIGKTEASPDIEIVKLRFAQVMFVGIITTFIFTQSYICFRHQGDPAKRYSIKPQPQ